MKFQNKQSFSNPEDPKSSWFIAPSLTRKLFDRAPNPKKYLQWSNY